MKIKEKTPCRALEIGNVNCVRNGPEPRKAQIREREEPSQEVETGPDEELAQDRLAIVQVTNAMADSSSDCHRRGQTLRILSRETPV